jgi:hypothetical protein
MVVRIVLMKRHGLDLAKVVAFTVWSAFVVYTNRENLRCMWEYKPSSMGIWGKMLGGI